MVAFDPSSLHLSTIAIAVSGLTKNEEACSKVKSSPNGMIALLSVTQYSAMAPPILYVPASPYFINDTLLPSKNWLSMPGPTASTVPEPSQPGVNGYFILIPVYLPLMKRISLGLSAAASTLMRI